RNEGWASQRTADIACRVGALPTFLTVTGDQINASSSAYAQVVVQGEVGNPIGGTRQDRRIYGSIAGRAGYLWKDTSDITRFYATEASETGTPTPTPGVQMFTPDVGDMFDGIVTVASGGNDSWSDSMSVQHIVATHRAILNRAHSTSAQILIMTVPLSESYPPETGPGDKRIELNDMIAREFPAHVVDMRAHLMSDAGAADAGITLTSDDQTDIANGLTPRQMRSDSVHFNEYGASAVAALLHREMVARGWVI
ncbi:MAG: SGNH/GDSL hydrolase family protein, partial [Brachybacterium sp.]|nr:SGNH/GDSL hydrolase family protein [Brachybacterium sp.]